MFLDAFGLLGRKARHLHQCGCFRRPRRDGVYPDALRRQLQSPTARQVLERSFARGIVGEASNRFVAEGAGDVYDRPLRSFEMRGGLRRQ